MKFLVTQLVPFGYASFAVLAATTCEALDVVGSMVERGATEVEIIDANGLHYDLIDLERTFDDEDGHQLLGSIVKH